MTGAARVGLEAGEEVELGPERKRIWIQRKM
jgi:hypothetical protein